MTTVTTGKPRQAKKLNGSQPSAQPGPGHEFRNLWAAVDKIMQNAVEERRRFEDQLRERDARLDEFSNTIETLGIQNKALSDTIEQRAEAASEGLANLRSLVEDVRAKYEKACDDLVADMNEPLDALQTNIEAFANRIGGIEKRVEEIGNEGNTQSERIDNLANIVEENGSTIAALGENLNRALEQSAPVADMNRRITEIDGGVGRAHALAESVTEELQGLASTVETMGTNVRGAQETANSVLEATRTRCDRIERTIDDITGNVTEAQNAAAEQVARIDDLVEVTNRTNVRIDEMGEGIDTRLSNVYSSIEQARDERTEISNNVATLASGIESAEAHIAESIEHLEDVRRSIEAVQTFTDDLRDVPAEIERILGRVGRAEARVIQLPKNLMIDSDGDLVGVDGEGNIQRIGHVAGRDGADGVSVTGAIIENGELQFTLSNGARFSAGGLRIEPKKTLGDDTLRAHVKKMHDEGKSMSAISRALDISTRQVRKYIREQDPATSRSKSTEV